VNPVEPRVIVAAEHLRLGACLVHSVPGASAVAITHRGERLVVSPLRRTAALDPCQLRAGLVAPHRPGVPHLGEVLARIDVVGGLLDIGGGLYQRSHPAGSDERWFVTPLAPDRVVELVGGCPVQLPDGAVDVRVCADTLLGAAAVCVAAGPGFGYRLDEVAHWLHAACLVDELIESAGGGRDTGGAPGS
jgi:hypothetical protein